MDLKSDDKGIIMNPFSGDKSSILQETRCFSEAPLNSKKCCDVLTKILNMINSGEKLTDQEWSDLFFGITRLFQSNNQELRRLVYLAIKSLKVSESEAFVVISSLIKDMNSNNDCYRANSLRVISKMADGTMIGQIERYLKSAIVDKNSFVASSALICGYNLALRGHADIPRRWLNEISECIQARDGMVQYHAIILLLELRNNDRLATQKITEMLCKLPIKSPYSDCLMLRQVKSLFMLMRNQELPEDLTWIIDIFHTMLRSRNEIVSLEAAIGITDILKYLHEQQDHRAIGFIDTNQMTNSLQMLLNSTTPVARFSAARILNTLADVNPNIVFKCQHELEPLLNDSNRVVATLVLTILLKIAQENNLDKFVKQIPTFISDISDSGKKDIVKASKNLILKYPNRHKSILSFLSTNLREEGSLEFKSHVIDTLFEISDEIPSILENILYHICETIEDCEYPVIIIRILGFLGKNIPRATNPSRYVRYIYNRLILESSAVRAASVDSLVRIALNCESISRDIKTLLQVCSIDNDDEVRDRTNIYSRIIDEKSTNADSSGDDGSQDTFPSLDELFDECILVKDLDKINGLHTYLKEIVQSDPDKLVDLDNLPQITPEHGSNYDSTFKIDPDSQSMESLSGFGISSTAGCGSQMGSVFEDSSLAAADFGDFKVKSSISAILERISSIVPLEKIGKHLFVSTCIPLTENESEYFVHVRKHFFEDGKYVALEFQVSNTLNNVTLKGVNVEFGSNIGGFSILGSVPIQILESSKTDFIIVLLENTTESRFPNISSVIPCRLDYIYCEENDPVGYNDVFTIDPLTISHSDCILPNTMRHGEFKNTWGILETSGVEHIAKFSFSYKTISAAVNGLLSLVNAAPCEGSEKVLPEATNHTLLFSGIYFSTTPFLCTAIIVNNLELGCLVKIACRSAEESVCLDVISCFEAV
ncbi:coatomer SEC21 gamma subunit like (beta adaptin) [Cryptosporidium ryanae]|uniref:coatomer SEC21 gamma subunit like (beta adaptin) n=1 Tax=Cryptosporidium ryanae TaxID=515981 RepID=UPI00351A976A|nr:coatomer SEC21 gamma subunit like (beta adaptin) [Cryptosporidium ryanae]